MFAVDLESAVSGEGGGTAFAAHLMSKGQVLYDVILAAQPVKTLIEPDEVAEVASFLVGPHGRSCNGAPVSLDQGWTAR